MKVIIDRFEGEYAIVELEIGKCVNIPKVLIPNSNEGDIVRIEIEKRKLKKETYSRIDE